MGKKGMENLPFLQAIYLQCRGIKIKSLSEAISNFEQRKENQNRQTLHDK